MNKKIVIINGSGGVGKDEFVNICSKLVKTSNISSIDKVKDAAKIFGWGGGKTEKDRLFLSNLKEVWDKYNGGSMAYIAESICAFVRSEDQLLFIHVREPRNIDAIKLCFECETLLITSNRVNKIQSNMADANVEDYDYDHVIHNDYTLDHLKQSAELFIRYIFDSHKKHIL